MTSKKHFEFFVFFFIAGITCFLLALRPIPGIFAPNDTGRYVLDFMAYCSFGIEEKPTFFQTVSYHTYFGILRPICWAGSAQVPVLLFVAAFTLPLSLLLFLKWHKGVLVWALSLVFSIYGLELMINALRQNLGIFFYFAAFVLVKKHRLSGLLLGAWAVIVHTSAAAFFPLLLWVSQGKLGAKNWAILSVAVVVIVIPDIEQLQDMGAFYSTIYEEGASLLFDLYIILPLYLFYFIRRLFDGQSVSDDERKCIRYSSVVLLAALAFFPAIAYRFALFAVPVQLFTAATGDSRGPSACIYSLLLSIVHLATIFFVSDQYLATLYG